MEKVSMSHEDCGSPEQQIRSVDVAKKLGVSKASVNKAIGLLKEKGLLNQPYYGDITLTEQGYAYGQAVFKRHRYLTAFLSKELGIADDVAEKEACLMEHAISDDSFEKWVSYIERLGIVEG